jgi:prolyl-tRNA synthetase
VFKGQEEVILRYCREVASQLTGLRVKVDDREDVTPGEKFYYWEKIGVPVRLEIGPREVAENTVVVFRRDTLGEEAGARVGSTKPCWSFVGGNRQNDLGEELEDFKTDDR